MKPFPLLNLPYVVFRQFENDLDICLMLLSLCSRKSRQAVKLLKMKGKNVTIHYISCSKSIYFEFRKFSGILWSFRKVEDLRDGESLDDFNEEYEIGDKRFRTRTQNDEHPRYTSICTDYDVAINCLLQHVKETFHCEIYGYHISREGCPNFKAFILEKVNPDPKCIEFEFGDSIWAPGYHVLPGVQKKDAEFVTENLRKDIKLSMGFIQESRDTQLWTR